MRRERKCKAVKNNVPSCSRRGAERCMDSAYRLQSNGDSPVQPRTPFFRRIGFERRCPAGVFIGSNIRARLMTVFLVVDLQLGQALILLRPTRPQPFASRALGRCGSDSAGPRAHRVRRSTGWQSERLERAGCGPVSQAPPIPGLLAWQDADPFIQGFSESEGPSSSSSITVA